MTANELLAETHPGRTILEDVVKPLGMSVNALAKGAPHPRHALKRHCARPAWCHGGHRAPASALLGHDSAVLAQSSVCL